MTAHSEWDIRMMAFPAHAPLDELRAHCRQEWGEGWPERDDDGEMVWHSEWAEGEPGE